MCKNLFTIVEWPECQHLMDIPGFRENSYLVNDMAGMEKFGSSAYFVDIEWLKNNYEKSSRTNY